MSLVVIFHKLRECIKIIQTDNGFCTIKATIVPKYQNLRCFQFHIHLIKLIILLKIFLQVCFDVKSSQHPKCSELDQIDIGFGLIKPPKNPKCGNFKSFSTLCTHNMTHYIAKKLFEVSLMLNYFWNQNIINYVY